MADPTLAVRIGVLTLRNPVLPASGSYGYGREYQTLISPAVWGAVVTKGIAPEPWPGNATPRVAETASGMLNAIGLQNIGMDRFAEEGLRFLRPFNTPVIVNIVGRSIEEYVAVAAKLSAYPEVSGFELNISCPNVKEGGIAFGTDPHRAAEVTAAVRAATNKTLIVKLSPNVTDITVIARAVEDAGADAVSLINTLLGMAIDARTRRPVLANVVGGLSGPAIKPVALRMVYQTYRRVKIPIIGMGGIVTATDAIEFILAGATAVAIGTGLFIDPTIPRQVIDGIHAYMVQHKVTTLDDLRGAAHQDAPDRSVN